MLSMAVAEGDDSDSRRILPFHTPGNDTDRNLVTDCMYCEKRRCCRWQMCTNRWSSECSALARSPKPGCRITTRAFRKLSKGFHPDKTAGNPELKEWFMKISEAARKLSCEAHDRAAYYTELETAKLADMIRRADYCGMTHTHTHTHTHTQTDTNAHTHTHSSHHICPPFNKSFRLVVESFSLPFCVV